MKIGILTYRQAPYISANTGIAYLLGEQLSKEHEVVFIGRKQDERQNAVREFHGIPILWLNNEPTSSTGRAENLLLRAGLIRAAFRADAGSLRSIVKENALDALLCMTAPSEDALIAYAARLSIPVILYQLDPYYNMNDTETPWLKHQFLQILDAFKHVFTTELLMKEYLSDPSFSAKTGLFSVLPFPKLIPPPEAARSETGETGKIRLLYAGTLYRTVRSPAILKKLHAILPDTCELRFCGGTDCEEDTVSLRDSGIVCLGYLDQTALAAEMAEADVLINIGNAVKNQMGSKIIDYIATGKPILNITQLDSCPTLPLLCEYDYVYHMRADEMLPSQELNTFVETAQGKRMAWETVEARWHEYTPAYAAAQILKQLER